MLASSLIDDDGWISCDGISCSISLQDLVTLDNQKVDNYFGSIVDLTFVCGLLLSWSCFFHSLRENSRSFIGFYLPKLLFISTIWFLGIEEIFKKLPATSLSVLDQQITIDDPNDVQEKQSAMRVNNYSTFGLFLACYVIYLAHNILQTSFELEPVSFASFRFRIQLGLIGLLLFGYSIVISIGNWTYRKQHKIPRSEDSHSIADVTHIRRYNDSTWLYEIDYQEDGRSFYDVIMPFNYTYTTSTSMLLYLFINSLYLIASAYIYWPVATPNYDIADESLCGKFPFSETQLMDPSVYDNGKVACKFMPNQKYDFSFEDLKIYETSKLNDKDLKLCKEAIK